MGGRECWRQGKGPEIKEGCRLVSFMLANLKNEGTSLLTIRLPA
jgi:hypothetical protein